MVSVMNIVPVIALILVCISGHANAIGKASPCMADLVNGPITKKDDRLCIAQYLVKDINALKAYVPSLTPDQKKWLEAEKSSSRSLEGDALNSKIITFSQSSEVQLDKLNSGLDEILRALNCVLNKENSLTQELLCWAQSNLALTDSGTFNEAIYTLNFRNIVDFSPSIKKQFGLSDSGDDPWWGHHWIGRLIQEHLVLPLIRFDQFFPDLK